MNSEVKSAARVLDLVEYLAGLKDQCVYHFTTAQCFNPERLAKETTT